MAAADSAAAVVGSIAVAAAVAVAVLLLLLLSVSIVRGLSVAGLDDVAVSTVPPRVMVLVVVSPYVEWCSASASRRVCSAKYVPLVRSV